MPAIVLLAGGVALLLGVGGPYLHKLAERRLVAALKEGGHGDVFYDYDFDKAGSLLEGDRRPSTPAWIRSIVGDNVFGQPTMVRFFPETHDDLLRTIGQLPSLKRVDLTGLTETSEPFMAISTLSHLTELALSGPIDLHDLSQISPMPSVTCLQLREMRVTDAACAVLVQKFPSLTALAIAGADDCMEPSERGLAALRKMPDLASLRITGSQGVSYAGLAGFLESSELKLLCAEVRGNVEQACLRIRDCEQLEDVEITQCFPLPGETDYYPWKLHIERAPNIKVIRVENIDELRLDAVRNLNRLALIDCNLSAADLSQLVACGALVELELSGFTGNLDAALSEIAKISSLRELRISGAVVTEGDIRRIGLLSQLEKLDLTNNDELDDHYLQQLECMTNLRSLKVWGTKVTAAGAKRLESVIPGLHCVLGNPHPGVTSSPSLPDNERPKDGT